MTPVQWNVGHLRAKPIHQEVRNISDYHTTPEEIGVLASNASVKKLILNHFVPPVFDEDVLVERIAKHFDGEIVVGKDLMQFDI